jgi:hypothetical protein
LQENLRVTSVKIPLHLRYHKPAATPQAPVSVSGPHLGSIDNPAAAAQQPVAIVKMQVQYFHPSGSVFKNL